MKLGSTFFSIGNNGQAIASTDFWQSDIAMKGFCWLTKNAGAVRMLVPKRAESYIEEILTGKSVTLEPSLVTPGSIDVVFEDGTASPFFLAMCTNSMDFNPRQMKGQRMIPFTVWTEAGLIRSFIAKVL